MFRESGVKNANFTAILPNLEVTDLNALEKCTLNYLDYGVSISTQQWVRATRWVVLCRSVSVNQRPSVVTFSLLW